MQYIDQMSRFAIIACFSILLGGCVASPTSKFIEVQEWLDAEPFALHFLWPLPDNFRPIEPPRSVRGPNHDYIWVWYSDGEPVNGIEPPIYMIYESSEPFDLGEYFLSDYAAEKTMNAVINVAVQGQDRLVELRSNLEFEDSGVALFEIDGTYIAFHWRHVEEAEALRVIESHLVPLKDHPVLAGSIEEHVQKLSDNQRR